MTGDTYYDNMILQNRYYGEEEWNLLKGLCKELYSDEELLLNLQSSLLDITAKESMVSKRRNVSSMLEKEIQKCFYQNEEDALEYKKKSQID